MIAMILAVVPRSSVCSHCGSGVACVAVDQPFGPGEPPRAAWRVAAAKAAATVASPIASRRAAGLLRARTTIVAQCSSSIHQALDIEDGSASVATAWRR